MLLPSIFGENLFDDDWMNFPFDRDFWGTRNALYGKHAKNMMKTDVRETDTSYEVDIDLPVTRQCSTHLAMVCPIPHLHRR